MAPVFTADTPPSTGKVGTPYSYTYAATGTPAPAFAVASGGLPAGLSLNSATGVLSGTPTTAAAATFTVSASNAVAPNALSPSTTITIGTVQVAPVFTADTPPSTGTVGTPYSYTYAATGTPAPAFAVASGGLPAGLSLNSATGVLSGTPTAAAAATFTVRASNGVAPDALTPSTTITIGTVQVAPVFTADSPPSTGTVGTPTATPTPPRVPRAGIRGGQRGLPAGLSLNSATGVLSGTPTAAAAATFTVRASNGVAPDALTPSTTITIGTVQVAPVFTADSPPSTGTVGTPYSYTYAATGTPAPAFAVASGGLPAGLSLNSATGVLSGTPTAAAAATFTVRASNGGGSRCADPVDHDHDRHGSGRAGVHC